MKKIYLNILGLKNWENKDLQLLQKKLENIKIDYSSIIYEPFIELKRKLRIILERRERSKYVWVEFISYWSGYTSNQRKLVGKHYRKIERVVAEKMPKYFEHQFSDNTSNAWNIKIVSIRGKDKGSYSQQIDEFLKQLN